MLKVLIIMLVYGLYTVTGFLTFLQQEYAIVRELRTLPFEGSQFPTSRTWERRLNDLPSALPGLLGLFGGHLVVVLQPWAPERRTRP